MIRRVRRLEVSAISKIELYVGSITKISEPYDVLVISAFPGDYTPTPTSIIGALCRDLKISVKKLADDKEENCKILSSWWSKQLHKDFPMRRILCYEGDFKNPKRSIAEVFGTLMKLGKNNMTVVMPLLASGDQNYSKADMMAIIFNASTCWMQAGFPIKLLKIVVYTGDVNNLDNATKLLLNQFDALAQTNWRRPLVEQPQESDIYMSYNFNDRILANEIVQKCEELHNGIRIKHPQSIKENEIWQEEIYRAIMRSSCIIAIISSEYLNDSSCIEQFNIALCCSRYKKSGYLVLLNVSSEALPKYMDLDGLHGLHGLYGVFDCRQTEHVICACEDVCKSIFISTIIADPVENDEMLNAVEHDETLVSKMSTMTC